MHDCLRHPVNWFLPLGHAPLIEEWHMNSTFRDGLGDGLNKSKLHKPRGASGWSLKRKYLPTLSLKNVENMYLYMAFVYACFRVLDATIT